MAAEDTKKPTAATEAKPPGTPTFEETRPIAVGTLVPSPAFDAEAFKERASQNAEREKEAAANLGAHVSDAADIDRLAVPMNGVNRSPAGLPPSSSGGGFESPVPPRSAGSGFDRENGLKLEGLGPSSTMLPLPSHIPNDSPHFVAAPFGSEPSFVDPKTGAMTYQPKTREHLHGVGEENHAATTLAKPEDAEDGATGGKEAGKQKVAA